VVSVTHPHGHALALTKAIEEPIGLQDFELRAPVLSRAWRDPPTLEMRDQLHSVADTQHWRDAEEFRIGAGAIVVVYRAWTATQDDPRRVPLANPLE
jgi:hypothetical protein